MKKLILGLIATILFSFSASAQMNFFAKSEMVVLATQARNDFVKGTTYKNWLIQQTSNGTTKSAEDKRFYKEL